MSAGGATNGTVGVTSRSSSADGLREALAVLRALALRRGGLGIGHREAALDLAADVLAVQLLVAGEERAVDVGASRMKSARLSGASGSSISRRRGKSAAASATPLAHERLGLVQPRDSDLELLAATRDSDRLEAGRERRMQPLAALDRRRHRADDVVARREREAALGRDEAVRRLEADARRTTPPGSGSSPPSRSRARARRRPRRSRRPSRRSSRPPAGPEPPGSAPSRSAGSGTRSRTRTRGGSSSRRRRSRRPRAAAPRRRSRRGRGRRRAPSRTSSSAPPCRADP